jgi:hypothetical protein
MQENCIKVNFVFPTARHPLHDITHTHTKQILNQCHLLDVLLQTTRFVTHKSYSNFLQIHTCCYYARDYYYYAHSQFEMT